MSMTYYAVTNDPNDLAHFGIPGMKWGVRHDKPRHSGSRGRRRSAAYKKASDKLGKLMKSGIRKAQASWRTYNSPAAREERFMNKSMEQARKGTLKYGKLTDAQVQRITERLALERNARQLGSTEKPSIGRRVLSSIGEGVISGIGQGFAGKTAEVIKRGSVLKTERLKQEQQQEFEKAKERRARRNADKMAKDKAKREFKQKQRDAEFDREQSRIKDEYEHDRDRQYMLERAQNAYLYGAKYTDDGKITGDSLGDFYRRHSTGITVQKENAKAEREAKREAAKKERETNRESKRKEREKRVEDRRKEHDRWLTQKEEMRRANIEARHALRRVGEELERETAIKRNDEQYERERRRQLARANKKAAAIIRRSSIREASRDDWRRRAKGKGRT